MSPNATQAEHNPVALERRTLGANAVTVTALGLGGAGLGGRHFGEVSEADAVGVVEAALEMGIAYIDTSPAYGESERRIGMALRGVPRSNYSLSTKVGTHPELRGYSAETTLRSVEQSLRELGTDHLDLLLIHDPPNLLESLAPNGALEALEALKSQGVIRAIGLGVRSHELLLEATRSQRFDAVLTFLDHTLLNTSAADTILPAALEHGIGVINGSPLAMGLLGGNDPKTHFREVLTWAERETDWPLELAATLWHWSLEAGFSLPALAVQLCLREPRIHSTLIGAKTKQELAHLFLALGAPIPATRWEEWRSILEQHRLRDFSKGS